MSVNCSGGDPHPVRLLRQLYLFPFKRKHKVVAPEDNKTHLQFTSALREYQVLCTLYSLKRPHGSQSRSPASTLMCILRYCKLSLLFFSSFLNSAVQFSCYPLKHFLIVSPLSAKEGTSFQSFWHGWTGRARRSPGL